MESMVAQIVSGIVYLELEGKTYVVHEASVLDKYIAKKIYDEKYREASLQGVLDEDELIDNLVEIGLWSDEEQKEYDSLPDIIEHCKVDLYRSYASYRSRKTIRDNLDKYKDRMSELIRKRNLFREDSAQGFAEACSRKYLLCCSVTDIKGNKVLQNYDYLGKDSSFCDKVVERYLKSYVGDVEMRKLCRNEPWTSLWSAAKVEKGIFGKPASMLTGMQKSIIGWSKIYDSVSEHPDSPPDEVVDDDDMLDGWLILQGRKRKEQKNKSVGDQISKAKGDEVYIMADNEEDARRVYDLNDNAGKAMIRTRESEIKRAEKNNENLAVEKTTQAQLEMRQIASNQFKQTMNR